MPTFDPFRNSCADPKPTLITAIPKDQRGVTLSHSQIWSYNLQPPPNVHISAPETWRTQEKGAFQPHLMPYCKDRHLGVWRGRLMVRIYHGLLLGKDICGRLSWGGVGYGGRHKKKKEKIEKKNRKSLPFPSHPEYPVKQKSAILLLFASSAYLLTLHGL